MTDMALPDFQKLALRALACQAAVAAISVFNDSMAPARDRPDLADDFAYFMEALADEVAHVRKAGIT